MKRLSYTRIKPTPSHLFIKCSQFNLYETISLFLTFLFTLSFSFASAEQKDFQQPSEEALDHSSLAAIQSPLCTVVGHHVSVITGEFVDSQIDLVLTGPEPLIVERSYTAHPSFMEQGFTNFPLPDGKCFHIEIPHLYWHFSHLATVELFLKDDGKHHSKVRVQAPHEGSHKFSYVLRNRKKHLLKQSCPLSLQQDRGLTNCGAGIMSAQTNPRLAQATMDLKNRSFQMTLPSGEVHYYQGRCIDTNSPEKDYEELRELYRFKREAIFKPSGNRIVYKADTILATNSQQNVPYSWLKFDTSSPETFTVTHSQGEPLVYSFDKKEVYVEELHKKIARYYLSSVKAPHKPKESLSYIRPNKCRYYLLSKKSLPQGRFLEIDYYQIGDSHVGRLFKSPITSDLDPRKGRVKELRAPVGIDEKPIVTHRFFYDISYKIDERKDYADFTNGITTVLDAYNRKTAFVYDDEHRLQSISRFGSQDHKHATMAERYMWGDYCPESKEPQKTHLLAKHIVDQDEALQVAIQFEYDNRGNVLKEKTYGQFSGQGPPLVLHTDGTIEGECYVKTFTYSQDGLNLALSQEETNGKKTLYGYRKGTHLLTSELIFNGSILSIRRFCDYDANGSLIKKVEDNGTSPLPDDLAGVTERRITYFFPRQEAPFGLPERIDEMYWDSFKKQECLLKRKVCHYSKEGWLLKEDTYDAQGHYCYSKSWEYNAHGRVIKEVDPLGQTILKAYDDNDNLIVEHHLAKNLLMQFSYDHSNRLVLTEYQTDKEKWSTAHRYDFVSNKTADIDRFGNETLFAYDDFNRLTKITYPPVFNEKEEVIRPTTTTEYDIFNNPIISVDERGQRTHKQFNARGQPTRIVYPDHTVEQGVYNLDGTLQKWVAPNGTYTLYTYDAFKRCLKEAIYSPDGTELSNKCYAYNGFRLIGASDAEGHLTSYYYDGAGRLIATACEGCWTTQEYDALGRVQSKKEWLSTTPAKYRATNYVYDFLDRITEEKVTDEQGQLFSKVNTLYDAHGNHAYVLETTHNGLAKTYTEYNPHKQPTKIIDPEGLETTIHYNDQYTNALNQRVLQICTRQPTGVVTIATHDALGRLVSIETWNPFGAVIAKQGYFYDAIGNKTAGLDYVFHGVECKKIIKTEWGYNGKNQVLYCHQAVGTPEQKNVYYRYNHLGQQDAITKPDGIIICHAYDLLGRLSAVISTDHSVAYSYEYNRNHQITRMTNLNDHTTTERSYDSLGRLTAEKLGHGLKNHYRYDSLHRLTHVSLPNGEISYIHDSLFLKEIQRKQNGALLYTHRYDTYAPQGKPLQVTLANQQTLQYAYDLCGRLKAIESPAWRQTNLNYDNASRLISYTQQDAAGIAPCLLTYDHLHHLTSEQQDTSHHYMCDSLHNRLTHNGQTSTFNSLHQIVAHPHWKLSYDINGNLTRTEEKGLVTEYFYDALDRLVRVAKEGKETTYQYDALHRRLSVDQQGDISHFLYMGANEVGRLNQQGFQEFRLLGSGCGAEIGAAVAIETPGHVYTPIHSHSGHLMCLLEKDRVVETYRYTAFGQETIYNEQGEVVQESIIGNPWRFASKRKDAETGFIYFGRRYYAPLFGTWITPDPAGFEDGSNLYVYLHHNPIAAFDAYGLFGEGYAYIESCEMVEKAPFLPFKGKNTFSNWEKEQVTPYTNQYYSYPAERYCRRMRNGVYCTSTSGTINPDFSGGAILIKNGMDNTFADAEAIARNLSDMAKGAPIFWTFNETQNPFVDALRCARELFGRQQMEAGQVQRMVIETLLKEIPSDKKLLQIAHSEGCIITRNNLRSLPREMQQRIIALAIAPGAYIDRGDCYKVFHYRSTRDFVPLIDVLGLGQEWRTTTILSPHPEAPLFDHTINSPTYHKVIENRIQLFQAGNYN